VIIMQRVLAIIGLVLCIPGLVGAGANSIFGLVTRLSYQGPLVWFGLLGLAMCYVVPFSLVLSAIGLAWSSWYALGPDAPASAGRLVTVFMAGVLFCCLHIALFLGWATNGR
jgi:hypothetical protein